MTKLLRFGLLASVVIAGLWLWLDPKPASGPPGPPNPQDVARAETLRPENAAINAIYERSCINCHSVPDAQAPLTGRRAAWEWRLDARGLDGLVRSAQGGYGNMPAMGMCFECTEAEFRGLIAFMSGETL